ncbi:hypothetical protein PsorP6_006475 [Peronosclerospora sorghi]|uniref:Uncharacterized protein n=1 Tax=Peronosclerospora sorghi TaxID=230839 RepID=A0ACC0W3W3_9STRA|nr:hypothetical protein PsorP6_006475 [Peronosclerospora sorghi]
MTYEADLDKLFDLYLESGMYLVACDLSETQSHCLALYVTPEIVCSHQVVDQCGWIGLDEADMLYRIRGVYRVIFDDGTEE